MVPANKWHSLISGKICLSGQLVGGHHTRSEPPGCRGRTREAEKMAGRQGEGAPAETCCSHWSLCCRLTGDTRLIWKTSLKFRLWSAPGYFCPSWAIFRVCLCVRTGPWSYSEWFSRPLAKAVWQILFHPRGSEVCRRNGKSIRSIWMSNRDDQVVLTARCCPAVTPETSAPI